MEQVIVIGAGPAGIEAAITLANHGKKVTVITDSKIGDWKLSSTAHWLKVIGRHYHSLSLNEVKDEINELNKHWSDENYNLLHEKGVNVILGKASFISENEVVVENGEEQRHYIADYFILSVGARPFFPDTMLPDGERIFSYHTLNSLNKIPKSILIVGDGPIGFEAVHIFSTLGSSVKWLVPENGPSSLLFDEEIDRYLLNMYKEKNVDFLPGDFVTSIEKTPMNIVAHRKNWESFSAEMAFLTLGFRSNLDILQVEKAGLTLNEYGALNNNEYGQTKQKHIYVVGDAEKTISAVYSMARARVAALHLLGENPKPIDIMQLPLSFHDYPEASQIGYLKADDNVNCKMIRYDARNLNSFLTYEQGGFLKLVSNEEKILIGASAVGYKAKELISHLALIIHLRVPIRELSTYFSAHPSVSEFAIHALHSIIDQ